MYTVCQRQTGVKDTMGLGWGGLVGWSSHSIRSCYIPGFRLHRFGEGGGENHRDAVSPKSQPCLGKNALLMGAAVQYWSKPSSLPGLCLFM